MASLRALTSTSSAIARGALLPRFSLNHIQIRTVLTVTAFEKAMQELHGDSWRNSLNRKQKIYIEHKEVGREQRKQHMEQEHGDKWEAVAAEEAQRLYATSDFQEKVQRLKEKLSRETNKSA